jgi:hypothetical protein
MPGASATRASDHPSVPALNKTSTLVQPPKQAQTNVILHKSPIIDTGSEASLTSPSPPPSTLTPATPKVPRASHENQLKGTCGLRFLSQQELSQHVAGTLSCVCKAWQEFIRDLLSIQVHKFRLSLDSTLTTPIPGFLPATGVSWSTTSETCISVTLGSKLYVPHLPDPNKDGPSSTRLILATDFEVTLDQSPLQSH